MADQKEESVRVVHDFQTYELYLTLWNNRTWLLCNRPTCRSIPPSPNRIETTRTLRLSSSPRFPEKQKYTYIERISLSNRESLSHLLGDPLHDSGPHVDTRPYKGSKKSVSTGETYDVFFTRDTHKSPTTGRNISGGRKTRHLLRSKKKISSVWRFLSSGRKYMSTIFTIYQGWQPVNNEKKKEKTIYEFFV